VWRRRFAAFLVAIAASHDPKQLERMLAEVRSEPMIFVVATGEPNTCGRGCTEWIAGQGRFDEGAAQRFREFLVVLAKRDLPIFFNSDGGLLREALQIGLMLRENRMTAGVARTVPTGCHLGPLDDACRRLMQSKREHKARLYFGGARCGSGCVYAIIGASTRNVDSGATLRINRGVRDENFLRRYVVGVGVDPALHALFARKVQRKLSNGVAGFAAGGSSLDQRVREGRRMLAAGPELRITGAAAQTRMVSVARIRLVSRKSTRLFKGITCDDISEFESYMPSHAVGSLWAGRLLGCLILSPAGPPALLRAARRWESFIALAPWRRRWLAEPIEQLLLIQSVFRSCICPLKRIARSDDLVGSVPHHDRCWNLAA
jgi:hypothetical protein